MNITYDKPATELIRIRKSARTHTGEAIAPDTLDRLNRACAAAGRGLLGESARFKIVEKTFVKGTKVKLGNYGLQKNPRYFFAGAIEKSDLARESYGYLLEQLVLLATDLGLGTCWIGFFDRKFFADFKVKVTEIFPATCTVGYAAERRIFEKITRAAVSANQRRPPGDLFFAPDFATPLPMDESDPYCTALEMVRLAPSSGNSQPWRIIRGKDTPTWHFFMKKVKDTYFRAGLHNIDMGIAMCHFELAAWELGLKGKWRREPPDGISVPPDTTYTMSWVGNHS